MCRGMKYLVKEEDIIKILSEGIKNSDQIINGMVQNKKTNKVLKVKMFQR